jgi:biopolymer transport protein ExbD
MSQRLKKRPDGVQQENVSLIPVMNLVCLLIPFLLYTASFVVYATLQVNMQRADAPCDGPDCGEDGLNLTVVITDQGFRLATSGASALPTSCGAMAEATRVTQHIPLASDGNVCNDSRGYPSAQDRQQRQALRLGPPSCAYDFQQLRQCIMDIKSDHPDESRIVISGERGTDYDVLIQTMDTARGGDDELFPDVSIAAGVA